MNNAILLLTFGWFLSLRVEINIHINFIIQSYGDIIFLSYCSIISIRSWLLG
jgi:hypothetical protein